MHKNRDATARTALRRVGVFGAGALVGVSVLAGCGDDDEQSAQEKSLPLTVRDR